MHYLKTDLDNFPTNKTALRMLARIAPIYDKSYVMKWLMQVMGAEYGEMGYYIRTFPLQLFPETATWGLKYIEQRYGIEVDETLTVDERRRRLILARPQKYASTPYRLSQKATLAAGVPVEVTEDEETPFTLKVLIPTTEGVPDLSAVNEALQRFKPSHLITKTNQELEADGYIYAGAVLRMAEHIILQCETPELDSVLYLCSESGDMLADEHGNKLIMKT